MPAIVRNLSIEQGGVFRDEIRLKSPAGQALDLTGCQARMQMRSDDGVLLLDLATPDAGLQIDGPSGTLTRYITAQQTALLPVEGGVYDLEIIPASGVADTWKLYRGRIKVQGEVTRD